MIVSLMKMKNININIQSHRDVYLDSIAGLLIIFMIYGHCAQMAQERDNILYIYGSKCLYFFMAWFFYKSGKFHKKNDTLTIVRKSTNRLIKPFIIYSVIGQFLHNIYLYFVVHDSNWIHYILSPIKHIYMYEAVEWNMPLWFLLTLFCVKIIFNVLINLISPIWCIIISLFVSCLLAQVELHTPVIIYNLWISLFFYGLGFYLGNRTITKKIIFVCVLFYIISIIFPSFVDIRTNRILTGHYVNWVIYCIFAVIFFNGIFSYVCKSEKFLSYIGKHSMFLFCIHWIFLEIIHSIWDICSTDLGISRIIPYFIFSFILPFSLIGLIDLIKLKLWRSY